VSEKLFECTKITAYFLWEYTGCSNALALWYCAEDLGAHFERKGYNQLADIIDILKEDVHNLRRIAFVRHIAFRIYVYTGNHDKLANWYTAEKLLHNSEWLEAVLAIASIYHENRGNFSNLMGVRSEHVKRYYKETV
jgi:hypothetical protein